MDDLAGLRNLKDFLLTYNRISESCFLHCVNHLSDRELSQDECKCVDMCTKKHVNVNHKVMQVYIEVQPQIVNKRIEEMNKQAAAVENAKKEQLEASEKSAIANVDNKPSLDNGNNSSALKVQVSDSNLAVSDNEVAVRTK